MWFSPNGSLNPLLSADIRNKKFMKTVILGLWYPLIAPTL